MIRRSVAAILVLTGIVFAAAKVSVNIKEWDTPSANTHPHDTEVGPDGSLWYTGQYANVLGRVDVATGKIQEYKLKTPDSGPHGLVADKEGNIWFTANNKAYIGRLNPKTGTSPNIRCRTRPPETPTLRCSILMESCGSPYSRETSSANSSRKPGRSR